MKKILSVLVVLMVISSVVFARRTDKPAFASGVAVVKNGTTFKLYYKGAEQSNVTISILDADKKVLYTEVQHNVNGFVRPYNLSYLATGEYTIEVADRSNIHTEKISVQRDNGEKLAHLFKMSEDGKYLLTVSNKDNSDITIRIYDGSDNVIYDKVEAASGEFAKVYNLKKYNGKFTFEISDANGKTKSITH
ncbi:MAG TPA: hypothetical protein VK666_16395 [Chryseolinea sp.]|nr:hypothetical protein [Chryseolinea sp.]